MNKQNNPDMVICPACVHEFPGIPENVQAELARLRAALAAKDAENKMLRRILARAIAEEACGADSEIHTVATECTEGKCWHAQARAALLRAEQTGKTFIPTKDSDSADNSEKQQNHSPVPVSS